MACLTLGRLAEHNSEGAGADRCELWTEPEIDLELILEQKRAVGRRAGIEIEVVQRA